jgi:hypothetical protein
MKKNLVSSKKEDVVTIGTYVRLPIDLKERAQIYCLKNKISLAELASIGIEKVIGK